MALSSHLNLFNNALIDCSFSWRYQSQPPRVAWCLWPTLAAAGQRFSHRCSRMFQVGAIPRNAHALSGLTAAGQLSSHRCLQCEIINFT